MSLKVQLAVCRSFAGEALERERFGADVVASYHSGVGFAKAKANVESLNRYEQGNLQPYLATVRIPYLHVLLTLYVNICSPVQYQLCNAMLKIDPT